MLRYTSLHVYMFRSICLGLYAMFSYILCLFLFYVDVGVSCSHACMKFLGYALLWPMCLCVYFHAIWLDPSLHMLICLDSCSSMSMCKVSTCLHVCSYAYMSRSMFHMLVCLDLCSLYALCHLPCACVLHAMFVCLNLGHVCHAMCYCSPFCHFISFLCFGLMVRTRSRPYGLCHRPRTLAYIKGFGSSYLHVYACLLLCFMLVLVPLVLGFATLDALSRFVVVWFHSMPMRPCLGVNTWEASPWCRLLRAYLSPFPLLAMICLPFFFVPPLALFASSHACLHVHAWVLLTSVSSMLQHNEVMDIRSKSTFVPCGYHLLFTFLFVYLFACLLAILLVCLLACLLASLSLCLPCISCLSTLCLLHMHFASFPSIVCLLVFFLCLCMYTHGARTHDVRHGFPSVRKKGANASMQISQVVVFNRFRSLAFPFGYLLF